MGSFLEAFKNGAGTDVFIAQNPMTFEVLDALRIAADFVMAGDKTTLPENPGDLISKEINHFSIFPAAFDYKNKVTIMPEAIYKNGWQTIPAVLGLDLGSTGAKAVLTSIETGNPLMDVYDRK